MTDTGKWADPWFRGLSLRKKALWFFLLDNCDVAGIWKIDLELASFMIGETYNEADLSDEFNGRIQLFPNNTIWIKKFVEFQYGRLSADCKPHVPVMALLSRAGIDLGDVPQLDGIGKTHNVSSQNRLAIIERDGYLCAYCGKRKEAHFLVIDHVVPRLKGGEDKLENLVASCVPCNSRKSSLDLEEFCRRYEFDFETVSDRVSDRVRRTLKEKDKDKDKDLDQDQEREVSGGKFQKPTFSDVESYCRSRKNKVNPAKFLAHYESNGWKVGKNPMKNWKAAVVTWENQEGR